tara:strand:+ start:276 stop:704 length:429 start_codon:yes stop_codon:yes gene_type:complete
MKKLYIKNYLKLFTNLNQDNINDFDDLVTNDIIFVDPFNNVVGLNNFKKIFYHMLDNVKQPRFIIINFAKKKDHVYLKWNMSFYAFNALQTIEGMSDITLDEKGKIQSHLDYWDSLNGLYVKLPFIGLLYRISLRMFKVKIN